MAGLVLGVVVLLTGSEGNAIEHLKDPQAFKTLCEATSSATVTRASHDDQKNPSLLAHRQEKRLTDLRRRSAPLLVKYSIDVRSDKFAIEGYNEASRRLLLKPETRYLLFGGEQQIALAKPPELSFDVDPETARQVRLAQSAGSLNLRILFTLDLGEDPLRGYCRANAQGLTLHARLLKAELHIDDGSVRHEDRPAPLLTSKQLEEESAADVLLRGERDEKGYGRRGLQVTLKGELSAFRKQEFELLLMPCFIHSLAKGGSSRAALVLEVHLDEGKVKDTLVAVDASGSQALQRCATKQLGTIERGPRETGVLRVTAYFSDARQ